MHRCQHSLKNSFKSMSCSCRIQQFPRNFLCCKPQVAYSYSFKSMVSTKSAVTGSQRPQNDNFNMKMVPEHDLNSSQKTKGT